MDYRNAFRWYQYDPTKWFIVLCRYLGLASHLRVFPSNEVEKGALTMSLKKLKKVQDSLHWPKKSSELPIISWETCNLPLLILIPKQWLDIYVLFQFRRNRTPRC